MSAIFRFMVGLFRILFVVFSMLLYQIWYALDLIIVGSMWFFGLLLLSVILYMIVGDVLGYSTGKVSESPFYYVYLAVVSIAILPIVKKKTLKRVIYDRSWIADQLHILANIIRPKEKAKANNTQQTNYTSHQAAPKNQNQPNDAELFNIANKLTVDGETVENIKRGIEIFENLANKGSLAAQVNLSCIYASNNEVIRNPARAYFWASLAAKNNEPNGYFNLGNFYSKGVGTEVDYEKAYNSYLMASSIYTRNKDKGDCFIRLGNIVRHGLGRDINLEQALSLYNSALVYGNEEARIKVKETQEIIARQNSDPAFSLEQAERLRWGHGTDRNVLLAIPFYEQAARLGDSYSQTELAYFYMGNEGVACDYPKAYYWATKASGKSGEANYYLAFCYHYGYGVGENGPSALNCYMNFINANLPDSEYLKSLKARAKYQIGCLYRDGKCGAADHLRALEWFKLAQQAGYEGAEKAAKEVRDYLEQQKNKSNKESYKLISCPGCSVNIRIPAPVPTAIIRCKACNVRLSIKQDNHGNIHVLLLNDTKQKGEQSSDMPMTLEDAARILGVTIHDDLSIIKNAWRTLRGQYHPDKLNQMGDKLKELAEIESKKINKAYQMLSNR